MYPEVTRQGNQGHLSRLQAEGAAALLAVEMGMHVVDGVVILATVAVGTAHGILEHARTVVDGMDEMMRQEQGDGAVDGRFIHRIQLILETLQRERLIMCHHRAQQQDAHCRGLHIVLLQPGDIFTLVLHSSKLIPHS